MDVGQLIVVMLQYTSQKADSSMFNKDFPLPAYKRRGNTLTVPNSQTGLAIMLSSFSQMNVMRSYEANHNSINGRHNHNGKKYDGRRYDTSHRRRYERKSGDHPIIF